MDAVRLDEALRGADWVISGEGRADGQSAGGKVLSGVACRAQAAGVLVLALRVVWAKAMRRSTRWACAILPIVPGPIRPGRGAGAGGGQSAPHRARGGGLWRQG